MSINGSGGTSRRQPEDAVKVTGEGALEMSSSVKAELILIDVPLQFEPVGVWAGER